MSRKEIDQISVFEKLKNRDIKQKEAVKILNLGIRQIKRKLKDYRKHGAAALIHKSRGKEGNHQLCESLARQAITLVREKYPGFGPTLASEKLWENHNLVINRETLRLKMIDEGLWQVKKKKIKVIHLMRDRKDCFGEMIQVDGSDHDWFELRALRCTLLAFIDDATGRIVHLEFTQGETTENLMRAAWQYMEAFGRPAALYTDRGGVYKVNLNNPDCDKLTQFERAMYELDIKPIHARSPQAKGRVERLFQTLQDRLVKELRLKGISSIEEANKFLKDEYIDKHNTKFAKEPKSPTDLHRTIEGYDLNNILCLKEERKVNNDFTIRYQNQWIQLTKKQPTLIFPKESVEVRKHLDGSITIHQNLSRLNFYAISQRPIKLINQRKEQAKDTKPWIPNSDHPWKKWSLEYKKSDILILQKSDISILA